VLGAVHQALEMLETCEVKLPPLFTAEVIACWISEFWLGMEFANLLGMKEEQIQHRAALDAMQQLLEVLDARTLKHAKASTRAAGSARKPKRRRT
jgi:hypothetical protein